MDSNSKIFVAGHLGMVGSAIIRKLKKEGFSDDNIIVRPSGVLDLRDQQITKQFFINHDIDYVFLSAAKVGGINANAKLPADFLYDNLMIQSNVIKFSAEFGVKKLLFLGSSCIYPKFANQPITEDQLLTGPLESTNEGYALAKIAGLKMCQAYNKQYGFNAISLMPTNLYGPNDNYNVLTGHVIPGLISKIHDAVFHSNHADVEVWGDGTPMREFLHVDDLADACYLCMQEYASSDIINVGTGKDITIKELVETIADIFGYTGNIKWNAEYPNGTPRKVLNVDKINSLGWKPKYNLREGLENAIDWYKKNYYGHIYK
jgi:GDP-L-fucose synthase